METRRSELGRWGSSRHAGRCSRVGHGREGEASFGAEKGEGSAVIGASAWEEEREREAGTYLHPYIIYLYR